MATAEQHNHAKANLGEGRGVSRLGGGQPDGRAAAQPRTAVDQGAEAANRYRRLGYSLAAR
jgi:hypothetical protein